MDRNHPSLSGWSLTRNGVLVLAALFAVRWFITEGAEESVRAVVRLTAQTSVVLFCAAFVASSLRAVWRSDFSAWLLRNRRYLGVTFAFSHLIHLVALVALGLVSPEFAAGVSPVTLIFGGLAYAFILAMTLTSNDRAVAALGLARWRLLHKVGAWYVWFIFAQSYLPRAIGKSPIYWLPAGLLLAVLGLRIFVAQRARRQRA
jgi:hypothetical protein